MAEDQTFKKLTAVVVVDAIEPVLPFYDAAGFQRTVEMPHGDRLGFVIFAAGGAELMFQTRESVQADEAAVLEGPPFGVYALFIEVSDLDAVMSRLPAHTPTIATRRKTFYGSTETIVRDPLGNVVTFAQME
jgi:uncharacterized glyoxalase superfamily protein PhnB